MTIHRQSPHSTSGPKKRSSLEFKKNPISTPRSGDKRSSNDTIEKSFQKSRKRFELNKQHTKSASYALPIDQSENNQIVTYPKSEKNENISSHCDNKETTPLRREARYLFQDEISHLQQNTPKSSRKRLKKWIGKNISKYSTTPCEYTPIHHENNKNNNVPSCLEKQEKSDLKNKCNLNSKSKENEMNFKYDTDMMTRLSPLDHNPEKTFSFEIEPTELYNRPPIVSFEEKDYSHAIIGMSNLRKRRCIFLVSILWLIIIMGIIVHKSINNGYTHDTSKDVGGNGNNYKLNVDYDVPFPIETIRNDCSIPSLITNEGREKCDKACLSGACCGASKESGASCFQGKNVEVCKKYSVCDNLLVGYESDTVNDICKDVTTNVNSFNECSEVCSTFSCCFNGINKDQCMHSKEECDRFSGCAAIADVLGIPGQ